MSPTLARAVVLGGLLAVCSAGLRAQPADDPPAETGQTEPTTPIPPVTEADRAAAFPEVEPHRLKGDSLYAFALLEQLEWQGGESTTGLNWEASGWFGGVRNRMWLRTEGQVDDGALGDAEAHVLYGRAVGRWWDVVVGLRQDIRPGPAQTWAAVGLQGLAPYWFELEVTGYVGDGGQTAARLEADYELLLTNRLILRPRIEVDLYGTRNLDRRIGAGLAHSDAGLRLRYEFRRELAPYLGVSWRTTYGETRDIAQLLGERRSSVRLVGGVRMWY